MIMNCDICGEDKVCKEYLCKIGEREDFMFLCNDCVKIQQKVGEVKEFDEVKEVDRSKGGRQMSELKARLAYFSEDDYDKGAHKICAKVSDCGYDRRNEWWSYAFEDEVYLKSEADKVIAEKDAKILRMIEDWNRLCEKYNKFIKLKQEFCDKFKDIELEITK